MYEVVWQYDENAPFEDLVPADAAEARQLLIDGNLKFAEFFSPHRTAGETTRQIVRVSPQDVGIGRTPGEAPPQEPFAAFLSCADARVPVELIFGQQANDLFVVRVAGNVLGDECQGSLDYAVGQLGTVRLLAVMGHTGCGAVSAAVDAYLSPVDYLGAASSPSLRAIVNSLMATVRGAAIALAAVHGEEAVARPGYRRALIETSVVLNAALTAASLAHSFHDALDERLQVSFGVYNLRTRKVGLPAAGLGDEWQVGLFDPPTDQREFDDFGRQLAGSAFIRGLLISDEV